MSANLKQATIMKALGYLGFAGVAWYIVQNRMEEPKDKSAAFENDALSYEKKLMMQRLFSGKGYTTIDEYKKDTLASKKELLEKFADGSPKDNNGKWK